MPAMVGKIRQTITLGNSQHSPPLRAFFIFPPFPFSIQPILIYFFSPILLSIPAIKNANLHLPLAMRVQHDICGFRRILFFYLHFPKINVPALKKKRKNFFFLSSFHAKFTLFLF
ncbi:MAG TPA: hypothetical protein DEB43_01720 [Desulfovibrio sp.]|nr:hypothetical protein [Desulfovibrio sp.]